MRSIGPTVLSLQRHSQFAIRHSQAELAKAQNELSTQRHDDVSLHLSSQTGRNIRWHAELSAIDANLDANNLHVTRADATQSSLKAVTSLASGFLQQLIGSRGAENGRAMLQQQARNAMASLQDVLNVDVNGTFLFAGRNQTQAPLTTYDGGPAEQQTETLFQNQFGMTNTDPLVQNLSSSQIRAFLNGGFQNIYESPNWETSISNATNDNVLAQLGRAERIDVLANTNEKPIRDLYQAVVSVIELTEGQLNDDSFKTLVDLSAAKVSSAVQGLADIQARVGMNQKALQNATDQLKSRKIWLNDAIVKTESVDTYEVATRINSLTTQLEASYSVTSRLSRISLLNYL